MKQFFLFGATAFVGVAIASPTITAAAETVGIDIQVQEIAELLVVEGSAGMVIDDASDSVMGDPSSSIPPGGFSNDLDTYAQLRLNTNYTIDNITVTFPQTNDIRNLAADPSGATTFNGTGYEWFGEAVCFSGPCLSGASTALGVFPKITGDTGGGTVGSINAGTRDASVRNDQLVLDGLTGGGDFAPGSHLLALGVGTNWSRTRTGEPIFADPGTYGITLRATIVP